MADEFDDELVEIDACELLDGKIVVNRSTSIDEINDRPNDGPVPIVCVRCVDEPEPKVEGAVRRVCTGCKQQIWLSENGIKVFIQLSKPLLLCIQCMTSLLKKQDKERGN